jgi:hypothetical protein
MITGTSELCSHLKMQYQIIGNMIKSKEYSKKDFAYKLAELEL